jgi:hypothetical protein
MENINDINNNNNNKSKASIPVLPSLGKKYSNYEAYLYSKISKNHYLFNEKYNRLNSNNHQKYQEIRQQQNENKLNSLIQCKNVLNKSSYKNNLNSTRDTILKTGEIGLLNESNNSFNLRQKANNKNNNNNRNGISISKLAEINSEIYEKNKQNNNPLSDIANELENYDDTFENVINTDYNNNNNNNTQDLNKFNSNECKFKNLNFENLINDYDLNLPSNNMLLLSGKNYFSNCQINPQNKKFNNKQQQEGVQQQQQQKEIKDDINNENNSNQNDLLDKYLENIRLETVEKEIINISDFKNILDNKKAISVLKNALRSYCFKHNQNKNKHKSLENFNAKIRNFNRIQMVKRRNESKLISRKEKLDKINLKLKPSISNAATPYSSKRASLGNIIQKEENEQEYEEIKEEILNNQQSENELGN